MKALLLLTPLLVIGCSRTLNTFEVEAPGALSAELQLCNKATPLERSGATFRLTRDICGEGSGQIVVRFSDRPPVTCRIGYVTSGMAETFAFKVDGDQCQTSKIQRS